MRLSFLFTLMLYSFLVVACARHDEAAATSSSQPTDQSDLPAPQTGGGDTLTGMTDKPGPNPASATPDATGSSITPPVATPGGDAMPPGMDMPGMSQPDDAIATVSGNPESGALPGTPGDATVAEPTADDATAVIRDYYASINSRSYARAYALWSDNGAASHQSPQQFADGFAQTAQVVATIGAPGDEDAGAGQRYIEVPVTLTATQADGSVRRYAGSYTLHRTVVDGASAEQRAWRISTAALHEVRQ